MPLTQADAAQVRLEAAEAQGSHVSPAGLQFPTWKTGTATSPYQHREEKCPG